MNHRDPAFTVRCRMTCLGGSERGECPCRHPAECEMTDSPYYTQARSEATQRMKRYLMNGIKESK